MAHKTLVGGTAYDISGGRTLVGGTGYSISKGRTLVDGTGYDINFAPAAIPVTIIGSGNPVYCYVKINNTNYYNGYGTSAIEVPVASQIILYTKGSGSANKRSKGRISINGKVVAEGYDSLEYRLTVPDNIEAISIRLTYATGAYAYGKIEVTTT